MVTLTGERISVGAKLSYSWLHMLTVLTSDRVSIVISPVDRMSAFLLGLQITIMVLDQFKSLNWA